MDKLEAYGLLLEQIDKLNSVSIDMTPFDLFKNQDVVVKSNEIRNRIYSLLLEMKEMQELVKKL